MFNKDKKKDYQILEDSNLSQKKKENRKSVRNNKSDKKDRSSVKDFSKLFDDQTLHAAGPQLEEIIHSYQKELNYHNELLDYLKEESNLFKRKLQEETEKCSSLMEQFEQDIAAARKIAEEERKERRHLQNIVDNLQTSLPSSPTQSSSVPIKPIINAAKNQPKPQNSKTKPTQKKKKSPN